MGNVVLFLIWLAHYISANNISSNTAVFHVNVCQSKDNGELPLTNLSIPNEFLPSRFLNITFDIRLRSVGEEPTCKNGSQIISWYLENNEKNITNDATITISPNGYLKYNARIYKNKEFCLKKFDENEWQFQVCNDTCGPHTPCIRKCCEPDEVWDGSTFPALKCRPSGSIQWQPVLYSDYYTKLSDSQLKSIVPITISHHPRVWVPTANPVCHAVTVSPLKLDDREPTPIRILEDGSVWRCLGRGKWVPLSTENMCIDGIQNISGDGTHFTGNEKNILGVKCSDANPEMEKRLERQMNIDIVYLVFFILSSISLLITLSVHLLIWEKHTVHVWTQVLYIASLVITYMSLIAIRVTSLTLFSDGPAALCRTIAIIAHFSFLSNFTWLTVINYDIYDTFRALRPTSSKSKGIKKLILYSTFAFGIPLIIVIVALTLESVYGNEGKCESTVITPDYGRVTCYVELQYAQLPYIYIPVGTLLAANLIFFALTVYSLYFIRQSTKFATSSSSKTEKQNQSVILFAKLFLIMGIPWVFEVISFATTKDYDKVPWYWVFTDILLICQAFSIFVVFVMKREMCRALESKFPKFKKFKEKITISEEKTEMLSKNHPSLFRCISCFCPCFPSASRDQTTSNKTQSQSLPSSSSVYQSSKSTKRVDTTAGTPVEKITEEIEMK